MDNNVIQEEHEPSQSFSSTVDQQNSQDRKNNQSTKRRFLFLFLSIFICLILIFINVYQYISNSKQITILSNKVQDTLSLVDTLSTENDLLQSEINKKQIELSDLKHDADLYQEIYSFLKVKNASNESFRFKTSSDIILMSINDPKRPFTLTTNISGGLTVSMKRNGKSANVEFVDDRWYGTTANLSVEPRSKGTSIYTFTNDQNLMECRIMIIVTD